VSLQPADLLDENGKVDHNKVRSIATSNNSPTENIKSNDCAEWRQKAIDAPNVERVSEMVGRAPDTVRRHISGECTCDHDTPALVYNRHYQQERAGSAGKWVLADE